VGSEIEEVNESGDWRTMLPLYEPQNLGMETFACVSESLTNCLETQLKWLDIRDGSSEFNFSGRYLAKESGTTKDGNGLWAVAESFRTGFACREAVWPHLQGMTWEQFYAEPSAEAKADAADIKGRFDYSWRWVGTDDASLREAMKYGPVQVCNQYHAFTVFHITQNGWKDTFDTYGADGRGILPPDYRFTAAMLHTIRPKTLTPKPMIDLPKNCLVIVADSGERLMNVDGTKLYADEAGKLLLEVEARNAAGGMSRSFPIVHLFAKDIVGVPKVKLNGEIIA
jgi:hypothetical protein